PVDLDITGNGDPERVQADVVSEEFFRLIDVTPLRGRTFQPADHVAGAPRVTVLTEGLWHRRFGGREVVGDKLIVAGVPFDIVGVLPARKVWPDTGEIFIPM